MVRRAGVLAAITLATQTAAIPLHAQMISLPFPLTALGAPPPAKCDYSHIPGIVWWGTERRMTLQRLAEYAAPIYWLSPDEPTLNDSIGKAIRVPAALPFEEQPDAPVVYYQANTIAARTNADGPGYIADSANRGDAVLDLHNVIALHLKYIAYFPREEGLGGHLHDVEPAAFRIWVLRSTDAK
jgi:hypothetical protein